MERIEQIAANRLRPALDIRPQAVRSDADGSHGYVVIDIPMSGSRLHMVSGRYYGRGEKTRRRLDDAEVYRLMRERTGAARHTLDALGEELARNPANGSRARLLGAVEPLYAPAGFARQLVREDPKTILAITQRAESFVPAELSAFSPQLGELHRVERRARGIARTNLDEGRTISAEDPWKQEVASDIEIQVSGAARFLASRVVYEADVHRIGPSLIIMDESVAAWSYRLVGAACALAERLEYRGQWGLGIHVYGLAGSRAYREDRFYRGQSPVYNEDTFQQITTASFAELSEQPHVVVERLVGDLIHALGTQGKYPMIYPD
ncbi:hypothetical protein BIU99_07895 [Plantibacter sp. MMLR14_011]|nr:hypothetical protein BIU99_07895 [Plantibacter sp. MMLR14_011]